MTVGSIFGKIVLKNLKAVFQYIYLSNNLYKSNNWELL